MFGSIGEPVGWFSSAEPGSWVCKPQAQKRDSNTHLCENYLTEEKPGLPSQRWCWAANNRGEKQWHNWMERVLPPSALGGREHVFFLFYSPTSAMKSIMSESHNLYLNTCYTEVYIYIYTHTKMFIYICIYIHIHIADTHLLEEHRYIGLCVGEYVYENMHPCDV